MKALCRDSRQHHVIFHNFYSVFRYYLRLKILKHHTNSYIQPSNLFKYKCYALFIQMQILCLGFLWVQHMLSVGRAQSKSWSPCHTFVHVSGCYMTQVTRELTITEYTCERRQMASSEKLSTSLSLLCRSI